MADNDWLGGAISGFGNLIGGLFGQSSDEKIADANLKQQAAFAQQGIRWRVEDAKRAGLHPLAALGANVASPAPVSVGNHLGEGIARMGQDIGRAVSSTQTQEERDLHNLNRDYLRIRNEGAQMDNLLKAQELRERNVGPYVGPAMPGGAVGLNNNTGFDGQGDARPLMKDVPVERNKSQPGSPWQEAGWVPDVKFTRTETGLAPIPPKDISEGLENNIFAKTGWIMRYHINAMRGEGKPPKDQLPSWADDWSWNGMKQEWYPVKGGDSWTRVKEAEIKLKRFMRVNRFDP